MPDKSSVAEWHVPSVIKEIGRGKFGAKPMDRATAAKLYEAMLKREVSDLQLGAILLAMRIKGEMPEEIAGFLDACRPHCLTLPSTMPQGYAPVLIPSYNGARKKPNLTPLLAMLLARESVPVFLHGVVRDAGRVTSAEIFQQLGIAECTDADQVSARWLSGLPAWMSLATLSPAMSGLLNIRAELGLRNSTHTLVKLLQPFSMPVLRLTSYTHREYLATLSDFAQNFVNKQEGALFLMRATEGETVANTARMQQVNAWYEGQLHILGETQEIALEGAEVLPDALDAPSTAKWIREVLCGERAVPANIQAQVELCCEWSRRLSCS